MKEFGIFVVCLALVFPAWAINKCTGADGHLIFQEMPCPGQGETVGEELARREQKRKLLLVEAQKQVQEQAALRTQYSYAVSPPEGGTVDAEEVGSGGSATRRTGVNGYTTKSGRYVAPYQRSSPSRSGGRR